MPYKRTNSTVTNENIPKITIEECKEKYPDLDISTLDVYQDKYVRCKLDGTPRKKRGHKKGVTRKYSKSTLAQTKESTKQGHKKRSKASQKIKKATNNKSISRVVTDKEVASAVGQKDAEVAFRANPGPQTDFLAAPEKDVLYG